MRSVLAQLGALLLAACVGSAPPDIELPPPRPERPAESAAEGVLGGPADDAATLSYRMPEDARLAQRAALNRRPPTDENATEIFLDHEIERRRYVPPVAPPERVDERIYQEVPPEVRDSYRYGEDRYRSSFPWSTAVGAGLGAVIGNQSGNRDSGAAIGAGVGLLFDLARWH